MDTEALRALLIRYLEESKLSEEVSEQMLQKILKILFGGEPDEEWVEMARALIKDRQKGRCFRTDPSLSKQ